jgi:hypothetical protein
MSEHGGNEESGNACTHFHFSNPVRIINKEPEPCEGRRLVQNWFWTDWTSVLRTVPVPVETVLVVCGDEYLHWKPKAVGMP